MVDVFDAVARAWFEHWALHGSGWGTVTPPRRAHRAPRPVHRRACVATTDWADRMPVVPDLLARRFDGWKLAGRSMSESIDAKPMRMTAWRRTSTSRCR